MGKRWSIETIEKLITEDPCILNEMPINKNIKTNAQLSAEADADEKEIIRPETKNKAHRIHQHHVNDLETSIQIFEEELRVIKEFLAEYGNDKDRKWVFFATAIAAGQDQLQESLGLLTDYTKLITDRLDMLKVRETTPSRVEPEGEPLGEIGSEMRNKRDMQLAELHKNSPEYYEWLKNQGIRGSR